VGFSPSDIPLPIEPEDRARLLSQGWRSVNLDETVADAEPYYRLRPSATTYLHQPDAAQTRGQRVLHKVLKTLRIRPHKERRTLATVPNYLPEQDMEPIVVESMNRIREQYAHNPALEYNYVQARNQVYRRDADPILRMPMDMNLAINSAYPSMRLLVESDPELWRELVYERNLNPLDPRIMASLSRDQDYRHPFYGMGMSAPSGYDVVHLPSRFTKRGGRSRKMKHRW